MATKPVFASGDVLANVAVTATANTNHDGSGTLTTIFTGTNGLAQRIDAIAVQAAAASGVTTAGKIRFFISTDGGTTKRKIGELTVPALTPSATVSGFSDVFYPPRPIPVLNANTIIYCSTNQAEAFVAQAYGSVFA